MDRFYLIRHATFYTPLIQDTFSFGKEKIMRSNGRDVRTRILHVQLDDDTTLQYSAVGEETRRKLSTASSAWSYYRDNIEEEFTTKRASSADTTTEKIRWISCLDRNNGDADHLIAAIHVFRLFDKF